MMRCAAFVPLAVALILSGGCAVNQKPKLAAVPPPPAPAPPPPPAPLVFPQNLAQAPPSQPIPPDAIPPQPAGGLAMAPAPEPDRPVTRTPPTRPVTPAPTVRPSTPGNEAPRPEPPPAAEAPTAAPTRQPSSLVSRSDQSRDRAAIEERIRKVTAALAQIERQNLEGAAKDDRDRATSMTDLARKALNRGDLRQADDLSSRAAILADALVHAR